MKIEVRVARRFTAEALTKPWLMGIRRGWLSLMKPSIHTWADVQKALRKLLDFALNLKEEVEYLRRGALRLKQEDFQARLDKAFQALVTAIKESRDRASAYQEWAESAPGSLAYSRKEDGESMLPRYQDAFEEATATSLPKKGGHGIVRDASLTEMLDRVLKLLREDAAAIVEHDKANPEAPWRPEEVLKEFSVGKMKFVLVMPEGKAASTAEDFAKYLVEGYALMRRKKMEHLWYGICFLSPETEKLSDQDLDAYEALGYKREHLKGGAGGWFRHRGDVLAFTGKPTKSLIHTMSHELGHRHWFKFMTTEQRARFANMVRVRSTGRDRTVEYKPLLDPKQRLYTERDISAYKKQVLKDSKAWEEGIAGYRRKLQEKPTLGVSTVKKRVVEWFISGLVVEEITQYIAKNLVLDDTAAEKVKPYWEDTRRAGEALVDRAKGVHTLPDSIEVPDPKVTQAYEQLLDDLEQLYQSVVAGALIYLDLAREEHNAAVRAKLMADDELRARFLADREKVPAVTDYGESNPEEAFAEAFAHYVTEADMTRDQMESLRSVLAAQRFRHPLLSDPWKAPRP